MKNADTWHLADTVVECHAAEPHRPASPRHRIPASMRDIASWSPAPALEAMRISEEIDAIEVMAIPSIPYLVTTRVIREGNDCALRTSVNVSGRWW